MNKIALFYDTETTGMPDWHKPSGGEQQPHIVQLAAALVDLDTYRTMSSINLIIRPEGWGIPTEASEVHGITNEIALRYGIDEQLAVHAFLKMWEMSHIRVAHNEMFDSRIIRIATKRYFSEEIIEQWKAGKDSAFCTMCRSTSIIKLPSTGRSKYKFPKLSEALQFFTGMEQENAHDAMSDVNATIAVYLGIMQWEEK